MIKILIKVQELMFHFLLFSTFEVYKVRCKINTCVFYYFIFQWLHSNPITSSCVSFSLPSPLSVHFFINIYKFLEPMMSFLPLILFPGSTFTPFLPFFPPSEVPSNIRTTEVTSSDITVLWGPIDSIIGYAVRYGVESSRSSQILGALTTEITISGLSSTTNYTIEVAAMSNAGIGHYSDPIIATTKGIHSIHCPFCLKK